MKKIAAYKTSDGKVFEAITDAKSHQRDVDFKEYYDNNKLYIAGFRAVTVDSFKAYLKDHADWIRSVLPEQGVTHEQ